jgi:hypothetical protein
MWEWAGTTSSSITTSSSWGMIEGVFFMNLFLIIPTAFVVIVLVRSHVRHRLGLIIKVSISPVSHLATSFKSSTTSHLGSVFIIIIWGITTSASLVIKSFVASALVSLLVTSSSISRLKSVLIVHVCIISASATHLFATSDVSSWNHLTSASNSHRWGIFIIMIS